MIVLQLVVYCLLFTVMVRYAVRGGAIDGLYFYPKAVQDRAIEIGLTDRETMIRKRKVFMTEFYIVMLAALVVIIRLWNHVWDFKTAYMQALLFLEVMNWYDGIFIDKVWVGTSRFWILPGCEDIPYVQTWPQVLKKRGMLTLIWIAGAGHCSADRSIVCEVENDVPGQKLQHGDIGCKMRSTVICASFFSSGIIKVI